jgi:hypothetical protein
VISVSRCAALFGCREGFGKANAVPTLDNNPGDLRHAPGAQHEPGDPDGIGHFATPEEGWDALTRQLGLYATRDKLTIAQAVYRFAPPNENHTGDYLQFIAQRLPADPGTLMSVALTIGDPIAEDGEIASATPIPNPAVQQA